MSARTLFAALESIPDHRTKKGRRFPLAAILAISIAAMLSGANDLIAIFRWGRRLSPKAMQALGVDKKRRRAPCHATYHYVFQAISAEDLARALGHLVSADGGLGCQTARNVDPRSEVHPCGWTGVRLRILTVCRACSSSNLAGLRYPSAEWSRLLL